MKIIQLEAGATAADLTNAVTALQRAGGGQVILAKNDTIELSQTLFIRIASNDITIDLNGGTLMSATAANGLIYAAGIEGALTGVTLGTDAAGNATITYDKLPADLKVGSFVKVMSDDALPGDHMDASDRGMPTRMGQAAEVLGVSGTTVTLKGALLEQSLYQSNVRASVYATGQFTIKNGTLDAETSDWTTSTRDVMQFRSLVNPVAENIVALNGAAGIKVVNGIEAEITNLVAKNVGGGVQSTSSLRTHVDGLFVEHAAHGVMVQGVGAVANAPSMATAGADIGLLVENAVTYDAARAAYDFHSESRNGRYQDVLAFDSRMLADFRGIGNGIKDSASSNTAYSLQFFEYGKGDGRDAVIDNVTSRDITNYAFILSGNALGNKVVDSSFESVYAGYRIAGTAVAFSNSTSTAGAINKDDALAGTARADKLLGGQGADTIDGGAGDDYIWGGAGADVLTGGAGRDRFAYNAVAEGGDTIRDFQAGPSGDVIDVSALAARLGWGFDDPVAAGHVRAVASGTGTLVQASAEGGWTTLATLLQVDASRFSAANVKWLLSDGEGAAGTATVAAKAETGTAAKTTTAPAVKAAPAPLVDRYDFLKSDGLVRAGESVTIAVKFDGVVATSGAGLSLQLSNGATASYAYGSGRDTLVFSYKVESGDDTADLRVVGANLGSAVIRNAAGVAFDPATAWKAGDTHVAVDTVAPVLTSTLLFQDTGVKGDGIGNQRTATLKGTGEAGDVVILRDNGAMVSRATVDASGQWSVDLSALKDGKHAFTVSGLDAAGNTGATLDAGRITVDAVGPARPMVTAFTPDTGKVGDRITSAHEISLQGTAEANSTVQVKENGVLLGSAVADAAGRFSVLTSDLANGTHQFAVQAIDVAGNAGQVASYAVTVDDVAPESALTRLTTAADGSSAQLRGTAEAGATVVVYQDDAKVGSAVANGSGIWIFNAATVANQTDQFRFVAMDAAGNGKATDGVMALGTAGNDVIAGSAGDDFLAGRGGHDVFSFAGAFGNDTVTDFAAGARGDVLGFDKGLFTSWRDALAHGEQVGRDVVFHAGHDSVTVLNANLNAFVAENFLI